MRMIFPSAMRSLSRLRILPSRTWGIPDMAAFFDTKWKLIIDWITTNLKLCNKSATRNSKKYQTNSKSTAAFVRSGVVVINCHVCNRFQISWWCIAVSAWLLVDFRRLLLEFQDIISLRGKDHGRVKITEWTVSWKIASRCSTIVLILNNSFEKRMGGLIYLWNVDRPDETKQCGNQNHKHSQ